VTTAGQLLKGRVKDGRVEVSYVIAGKRYVRQRVDPASPKSIDAFLKALSAEYVGLDEQQEASLRQELMNLDVDELRAENGGGGQGRALELRTDEAWDEPVDGTKMLDELVAVVQRHVVLPLGAAEALALWVVHTYVFDCADTTPRLGITSPEKGCGKSTVLDLLAALVHRPLPMSNVTTAAVFRAIELSRPTLLVDEADSFLVGRDADDELRGVLNSGHIRTGSVIRCVGDDAEPRQFATFSPCAIALIGDLPSTLEDRSISIRMRRRAPGETVARMRRSRLSSEFESLRQRIVRWGRDNRDRLQDADPDLSTLSALSDRAQDNWRLPIAIADVAGGDWPTDARAVALQIASRVVEETSPGVMLLTDIRDIFERDETNRIPSERLVARLIGLEDRQKVAPRTPALKSPRRSRSGQAAWPARGHSASPASSTTFTNSKATWRSCWRCSRSTS